MKLIIFLLIITKFVSCWFIFSNTCNPCKKSDFQNISKPITCDCSIKSLKKIVGGYISKEHSYPWQVYMTSNEFTCSGTLINNQWILTAAHCINRKKLSNVKIYLGKHDLENISEMNDYYTASCFHYDSLFNHEKLSAGHDIGLIKLNKKVEFIKGVIEPACLGINYNKNTTYIASGWGEKEAYFKNLPSNKKISVNSYLPNVLYEVKLKLASQCENCKLINLTNIEEESGTCDGDSGGPLHVIENGKKLVVGITSFSRGQEFKKKNRLIFCTNGGTFTNIKNNLNYLDSHLKNKYCLV